MSSIKCAKRIIIVFIVVISLSIPLFIFLNRFLLPDSSFDSLNYHLFLGERFLSNKYQWVEFYPAGLHNFFGFFDYIPRLFRNLLGYRVGTIFGVVFYWFNIYLSFFILKIIIGRKYNFKLIDAFLFFNVVVCFESLFQLSTYYVDNIATFFMLLSIVSFFLYLKRNDYKYLFLNGLLLGVTCMGKYTNFIFIFPFFAILFLNNSGKFKKYISRYVLYTLLVFAPFILSSLGSWLDTGNPIFPYYNNYFRSVYAPYQEFKNGMFGPVNLFQKLTWPIYSLFTPQRLGEVREMINDGKIAIYFLTIVYLLIEGRFRKKRGGLSYTFLLFSFLMFVVWSFTFGYARYGINLEFVGGVVMYLWYRDIDSSSIVRINKLLFMTCLLVLMWRNIKIIDFNQKYDISWRSGYSQNRNYLNNIKYLPNNKIDISQYGGDADMYLNCSIPNLGYYVLSDLDLPILNIDRRVYATITTDFEYMTEANQRLTEFYDRQQLKFVTISGKDGLINQSEDCLNTLRSNNNVNISEIHELDNFLGNEEQKIQIILGDIRLN